MQFISVNPSAPIMTKERSFVCSFFVYYYC